MDNGTGETMVQALMVGVDVGVYGRLATRDHIRELAALAESSGGVISGCACAMRYCFSC